jgi:polysaccharide deacetylase family protein (PEP-CTERM system associated)
MADADADAHPAGDRGAERRHVLSFAVEDHFQVSAFSGLVRTEHWHRFEPRIERNTQRVLDLLDEHGVKATFFTLGWVADEMPGVVQEIVARGHEIASKGYLHRSLLEMGPEEFRADARRSRIALEQAAGVRVLGYRLARGHLETADHWALDVLAEEGYRYDSSVYPRGFSAAGQPWLRRPFVHRSGAGELHELPLTSWSFAGLSLPIAGGAWLRHAPHKVVGRLVAHRVRSDPAPLIMYFHVWELDEDLPRITGAPRAAQYKQYHKLEKTIWCLRHYMSRHRFGPARDWLQLASQTLGAPATPAAAAAAPLPPPPILRPGGAPVTLVVPCYNEERVLRYLRNTLAELAQHLAGRWSLQCVFVDDGSSDATYAQLLEHFGREPGCQVLRHDRNAGVAAAILTGLRHAETEVVCSIDCDCTYDPHQIERLLPLLGDDVAVVTASPYHPLGEVRNVPGWRLFLSRGLSFVYRRLFRQKLYTYTSCFRAYRRSRVADIELRERGFLGVAEFLMLVDRRGQAIAEAPAVLETRLVGHSKMKVLRTIGGHLRLIGRMLLERRDTPRAPGATPLPR